MKIQQLNENKGKNVSTKLEIINCKEMYYLVNFNQHFHAIRRGKKSKRDRCRLSDYYFLRLKKKFVVGILPFYSEIQQHETVVFDSLHFTIYQPLVLIYFITHILSMLSTLTTMLSTSVLFTRPNRRYTQRGISTVHRA